MIKILLILALTVSNLNICIAEEPTLTCYNHRNLDCGEGAIKVTDDGYIKTPNGSIFKVQEIQRGTICNNMVGSCGFNVITGQLFIFQYGELIPGVAIKVRELKRGKFLEIPEK